MSDTPSDATRVPARRAPKRPPQLTEDVLLARLEEAQRHLRLAPEVWSILVDVICPDDEGRPGEERPLPAEPTRTLPGTAARIAVLTERARLGVQLFHPDDATFDDAGDRYEVLIKTLRNGDPAIGDQPILRRGADGPQPAEDELQPRAASAVEELAALVRGCIERNGDLEVLADALEASREAIPELCGELGLDVRELRAGGGTFLRALMGWVRRERKRHRAGG